MKALPDYSDDRLSPAAAIVVIALLSLGAWAIGASLTYALAKLVGLT